jgi:ATP synthase protein I
VGLQALVVAAIALGFGVSSWARAFSALLGGAACVLPGFYFARHLFATVHARAAKKIIKVFFLGEIIKLALSAGLIVLILLLVPVSLVPLIVGFAGAQFGFWLAPAVIKIDSAKEQLVE